MVGCVYYEAAEALVLVDPLAPPEGTEEYARFWNALDRDLERAQRPLAILLSSDWHERSAQAVYDRYREQVPVAIWAHEAALPRVACVITATVPAGAVGFALPGGVHAYEIGIPYQSELAFYLPADCTLVCGDSLIGVGAGRVRVTPSWWVGARPEAQERYRALLRPALRRLLDLPIDLLITSHGPPVLARGREALEEALAAPAWGEEE